MSLRFLLLLTLVLPSVATLAATPALEPRVERTLSFLLGNRSGFQETTHHADGTITVHYEYNDRGRGPKLDAKYTLAADGTPDRTSITGLAYFKTAVDETFARTDAETLWKNGSENEKRAERLRGFYIGLESVPEDTAMLARALLKSPDRSLPVLPVGDARIREVTTVPLRQGRDEVTAALYAIEGLDLSPSYVWLDENQRLFGVWSGWQSMIREGWEKSLPELGKAQDAAAQAFVSERAKKLTQPIKGALVISNVRLFDPITGTVKPNQNITIIDGRIKAVSSNLSFEAPDGLAHIDGKNRFAMPGLWDMHVHLSGGTDGLLHLAGGVTTVRDLANDRDALNETIKQIELGNDIGPRVIRAGFVDGRSPFSGPTKVFADNEDEVRAAMAQFAKDGFEQVKVYSSLKPELVPLFAELAHKNGMRLSGHVPDGMSAEDFVRAGADEIQHANFLMLNLIDRTGIDTRTPQRFSSVAAKGASVSLNDPAVQRFIDLLVDKQTVIDPTLGTFEGMFLDRPGKMGPTYMATIDRLPTTWQRYFRAANGGLATDATTDLVHRESYRRMMDLVGLMHRSGVKLVAGTDTWVGFGLARELELYTQAGIPPVDALKIATWQSAQVMKRDHEYGLLAPGYVADVILIDGDPTRLITDLRRVHTVIRGDRIFDAAALYEAIGIKPH